MRSVQVQESLKKISELTIENRENLLNVLWALKTLRKIRENFRVPKKLRKNPQAINQTSAALIQEARLNGHRHFTCSANTDVKFSKNES